MAVDAIVLAGAPADPDMQPVGGSSSRAMVEIGPKTMLQWVVDALEDAESVGRIIAVGEVAADGLDEVVPPAGHFLENMVHGLDACGTDGPVLILSSDIPLVTGDAVVDFVERALASGGEMCYPIIPKDACLAKYPQMKRTYLKTKEGTFTGGNMVLLSPAFLQRNEREIARAYAARKKPFALARTIGLGILLRALLAQLLFPALLPIPMLERALSEMLGGRVVAIITSYVEIGEDVDKVADLEAVRAILAA